MTDDRTAAAGTPPAPDEMQSALFARMVMQLTSTAMVLARRVDPKNGTSIMEEQSE